MLTSFDIIKDNKLSLDNATVQRIANYNLYRQLFEGKFSLAFPSTVAKLLKRYPIDDTTSQTLVEINLFKALTEFFKFLITNNDIYVNVDESLQDKWNEIAEESSLISVVKEVFTDNSRFGNGIFKVALIEGKPQIFSICPDCWFPVFKNGNLNEIEGHILAFNIVVEDKKYKHIEKHHKGHVQNEVYKISNDSLGQQLTPEEMEALGIVEIDDFSEIWDDFIIFPVKNTTVSDCYFGESDYENCKSVVEEIMLTVSQNSKILNRHANPKLSGSEQNLELNPITGDKVFPNSEYIPVGRDGIKPEYITADLQAPAIKQHIDMLMQFFFILTKTPPQAYGVDVSGNMSGESLKKIFMAALSKVDDIKQVSFTNALKKVAKCAMAFNGTKVDEVKIDWGNPIPEDYSEKVKNNNDRVIAGTISKKTAIMDIDNISEDDAQKELDQINAEQKANTVIPLENIYKDD